MLKPKPDLPRGVLHLGRAELTAGVERFEPSDGLRAFIEHYWMVRWENQPPAVRETVPHPSVHLVLEPGRSELHGVHQRRFSRTIEGTGRVLGTKFRPGGFRALAGGSVARFTGKVIHPAAIFGPRIYDLEAETAELDRAIDAFERIDGFLNGLGPVASPESLEATRIVYAISEDRSIARVESLVEKFGIGLRQLQRLFREYVGVSPKWVIQRYRLIEAADRMRAEGESVDAVALALELGYSDQPHFIRDFKKLIGKTPAEYVKSFQGKAVR